MIKPTHLSQSLGKAMSIINIRQKADFFAPLALRLYLAPIMWMAGLNKFNHFDNTVQWFGNPDWGLGLPLPSLMTALVTTTE